MAEPRMVTARTQRLLAAAQIGSVRTDRMAPSSHGPALGLITPHRSLDLVVRQGEAGKWHGDRDGLAGQAVERNFQLTPAAQLGDQRIAERRAGETAGGRAGLDRVEVGLALVDPQRHLPGPLDAGRPRAAPPG